MEIPMKITLLQNFYTGVLADNTLQLTKEGILNQVTLRKKNEQLATGKARAQQLGITEPQKVFSFLSDLFACANWQIIPSTQPNDFLAEATGCKLCAVAKKMGSASPCELYCLNPMEGMIKGINDNLNFDVKSTLWSDTKCQVMIKPRISNESK